MAPRPDDGGVIADVVVDGHRYLFISEFVFLTCGAPTEWHYNQGCRCQACTEVHRLNERERRTRRTVDVS